MSGELADKLQKEKMNSAIFKVLEEHGITTLKDLLAKTDSEIDKLPLKPFQKEMLKNFCENERKKEQPQQQQQSRGGGSVKYTVRDSSLDVGSAHSGSKATFIDAEGAGAVDASVDSSSVAVKTLREGSSVSAISISGGQKRRRVQKTEVTFERNKMATSNEGRGGSQAGIKVQGHGEVRVKCAGNVLKMRNKGKASGNLQASVYTLGGGGSPSLESGGNELTMENEDDASHNAQALAVGVEGAGSSTQGVMTRSGRGGDRQTMTNSGRARSNVQARSIRKINRK